MVERKRVKVRVEHLQKTFYERFLHVLRTQTEDKNQKYTIYKAHTGLKSYPLEVRTIADLKHINGIGETLAIRCHSAWEAACAAASPSTLDLKTVKKFSDDDFIRFIGAAKKQKAPAAVSRSSSLTEEDNQVSNSAPEKAKPTKTKKQTKTAVPSSSAPVELSDGADQQQSCSGVVPRGPAICISEKPSVESIEYVACQPSDQAEVILIADQRENNAMSRGDTVVECLSAAHHRVEMRSLSVGDYIWIARKIDGTEMILEWIVERKTWSDLQQSIRKGRYSEQKQRLRRSPMKNRVYLVEGTFSSQYSACEQALASTMVTDGFMIQKTKSPQGSAQFLLKLTEHLKSMVASRQVTGMTYDCFQELFKKPRAETVKDTWTRQLMVCPGMSADRAEIVSSRFPSMASMIDYYISRRSQDIPPELLLNSAIPEINKGLSSQMCKFFSSALDN